LRRKRILSIHEKWVSMPWISEPSSLLVHRRRSGSAATANANLLSSSTPCNTNADAGVRVENGFGCLTSNSFPFKMELLINLWSSASSERGFHRTKLSDLELELRMLQDDLPRDRLIAITSTKIKETLREKSRSAIETAYRCGNDWYIWRGSERTVDDKNIWTKSIAPPK